MQLKLGFIGTGVISDAVIRGICNFAQIKAQILISPRNAQIAQKLQNDFSCVKIADNNQEVINASDYIFIALRRQILEAELGKLNFHPKQIIVSFVPTISRSLLAEYTRQNIAQIYRAVPLPFIKDGKMVTPIFPPQKNLQDLFSQTGGTITPTNEAQFDLFMLGGSMMGIYFKFADICANWLNTQGLECEQANLYLAQMFNCLSAQALNQKNIDFAKLQQEYSTPGGTNELITNLFATQNGAQFLQDIFNQALQHNK